MNHPDEVSIQTAEAVGAIAGEMIQCLLEARTKHPELDWRMLIDAAGLAMRSLELIGMQADPAMSRDQVKKAIVRRFAAVLTLPDQVIRLGPADGGLPDRVEVLPVWRQ